MKVPMNLSSFFLRLAIPLLLTAPIAFAQPRWPQFRGPNSQGISHDAHPPVTFGPRTNLTWKTPVAPGLSSPVIWAERIFLTTFQTGQLSVVSFDRQDGREQWRWSVEAGPIKDVHASSSPAASSVAADEVHVYAYFGSWGIAALRHDGTEVWRHPLTPPKNRYGMATSPVLHGTNVLLVLDADDGNSRVAAFSRADGHEVWHADRQGQRATWSTPALWTSPSGDREELIVLSAMRLAAYDPRDGHELWTLDGFPQETVSVPAVGRDLVFAAAAALGGRSSERYDAMNWKELLNFDHDKDGRVQASEVPDEYHMVLRPDLPRDHPGYAAPSTFKRTFNSIDTDKDGAITEAEWDKFVASWEASSKPILTAIRPGATGNARDHVAWSSARGLPEMPSILLYRDRVFMVRDGGLLTSIKPTDGTMIFQERLGPGGQYCASPVAADGHVYFASVPGVIAVIDATSDTLRVLAQNDLGEPIQSTPAIAGNSIYVRTAHQLMAFSANRP